MITEAVLTGEAIVWGAIGSVALLTAFFATAIVAAGMRAADSFARWWNRRYVTEHDTGPDPLRLLEDLDEHLDTYAELAGLFERLGPPPSDLDGLERLRRAVRNAQKGDHRDAP